MGSTSSPGWSSSGPGDGSTTISSGGNPTITRTSKSEVRVGGGVGQRWEEWEEEDNIDDGTRSRRSTATTAGDKEERGPVTEPTAGPPPPPDDRFSINTGLSVVTDILMTSLLLSLISIIVILLGCVCGSWIYCAYHRLCCCSPRSRSTPSSSTQQPGGDPPS